MFADGSKNAHVAEWMLRQKTSFALLFSFKAMSHIAIQA